jgi:hypothetical protein
VTAARQSGLVSALSQPRNRDRSRTEAVTTTALAGVQAPTRMQVWAP